MSIFVDERAWLRHWDRWQRLITKRCLRCVHHNLTQGIRFDANGVCNYCHNFDAIYHQFPGGDRGERTFFKLIQQIKKKSKNLKYDLVIGVNGEPISLYIVHIAKTYGLRPLAVFFDNSWHDEFAIYNMKQVLINMNVPLITKSVDAHEYDELYKSILKSGIPALDMPTSLGVEATLHSIANQYGVKTIFEGHSYHRESVIRHDWLYLDAKMLDKIFKSFGKGGRLKSYPYFWLSKQFKWYLINQVKVARPMWELDNNKLDIELLLSHDYGWKALPKNIFHNLMKEFYQNFYLPRRYDFDMRVYDFSAQINAGLIDRKEAMQALRFPPDFDVKLLDAILNRWQLSIAEFDSLMQLPQKKVNDFKNYLSTINRLNPLLFQLAKADLIPWHFYMKYNLKMRGVEA